MSHFDDECTAFQNELNAVRQSTPFGVLDNIPQFCQVCPGTVCYMNRLCL